MQSPRYTRILIIAPMQQLLIKIAGQKTILVSKIDISDILFLCHLLIRTDKGTSIVGKLCYRSISYKHEINAAEFWKIFLNFDQIVSFSFHFISLVSFRRQNRLNSPNSCCDWFNHLWNYYTSSVYTLW